MKRHTPIVEGARPDLSEDLVDTDLMPIGQYRWRLMRDVPADYLRYLWKSGKKDEQHCQVARYIRANRTALGIPADE